jgi:hypothetical protein
MRLEKYTKVWLENMKKRHHVRDIRRRWEHNIRNGSEKYRI